MSSTPTAEEITGSARWLVQALDPASGLVRLIEMDRDSYRSASFLDDRMLQQPVRQAVGRWSEVAAAVGPESRSDARWIFHIGHVGSTLVSRLLGELAVVLAVREPRILRDVAMLPPEQRAIYVPPLRRLFSRTFEESETALVKATSFVSEIAAELAGPERALLLHASPRAYIATILAAENSPLEMRQLAESRRLRLAAHGINLAEHTASSAHLAAAAWACEMTALEQAEQVMTAEQALWVDFDDFLARPAECLGRIAAFFDFPLSEERARELTEGPLMRRYSKALEYDYSPGLRRELLAEAARDNRADIDSALAMLHRAAEKSPLLDRALGQARTES